MTKLTKTEQMAKETLEKVGWTVFKPSWPDFIIYTDTNPTSYCFVEIKRDFNDGLSLGQEESFSLLRSLGFPVRVLDLDTILRKQTKNSVLSNLRLKDAIMNRVGVENFRRPFI